MRRIIILCLVLLIAISLRYSYAQQSQKYSEAGNAIEVDAGQDILITLEANQTTGFKWQLAGPLDKNILELVTVEYILGYARFLGAGGKEVWTFKALRAGKTKVSLEYLRPWERNARPAKEKTFSVTVKEHPKAEKQSK